MLMLVFNIFSDISIIILWKSLDLVELLILYNNLLYIEFVVELVIIVFL